MFFYTRMWAAQTSLIFDGMGRLFHLTQRRSNLSINSQRTKFVLFLGSFKRQVSGTNLSMFFDSVLNFAVANIHVDVAYLLTKTYSPPFSKRVSQKNTK